MLNTLALNSNSSSVRSVLQPYVVGEFEVGEVSCLAIAIKKAISDSATKTTLQMFLSTFKASSFAEVLRSSAKPQNCIIAQTDYLSVDPDANPSAHLIVRALQISPLVTKVQPNKQIAKQPQISERTVANYLPHHRQTRRCYPLCHGLSLNFSKKLAFLPS
ncbi:hypothetical protein [Acaryochloris sp. IP29b_bin.137]|uniref:hypothetical protein n=1 Tax=Acaryochloris sp. IP29b_bin.137 TaxID=2969217 RepID=UPI0026329FA9|nr:hypothetical protein [Acaryochloris sp. IP29b_bin.137]